MAFQDQFGYWNKTATYGAEVHATDLVLSFYGCMFCTTGIVSIYLLPSTTPNVVTWMGCVPCSLSLGNLF